jgi:hypothetical protein
MIEQTHRGTQCEREDSATMNLDVHNLEARVNEKLARFNSRTATLEKLLADVLGRDHDDELYMNDNEERNNDIGTQVNEIA